MELVLSIPPTNPPTNSSAPHLVEACAKRRQCKMVGNMLYFEDESKRSPNEEGLRNRKPISIQLRCVRDIILRADCT